MLTDHGVTIKFIQEGLEFGPGKEDPFKKMMLQMLGSFAEFERNISKQRQAEGIAKAKERGAYERCGRPSTADHSLIVDTWDQNRGITITKLAKSLGYSRSVVHRVLSLHLLYKEYDKAPPVQEKQDKLKMAKRKK